MPNFVIQVPPDEYLDFVSYLAGSNSNQLFCTHPDGASKRQARRSGNTLMERAS